MFRPTLPILLLLLALLAACGHKGPVQPLKQPLPAAPRALKVQQKGTRFLVAWSLPRTNQDGSPLTDLQGFRVFKMKYDLAQDCPECRDTSVLLTDVDLEFLREVRRSGDRLYLWDDELEPGFGYQYRIVPFTAKGRSGAADLVRVPFVNPPEPPPGLVAEGHDRMARLGWAPAVEERMGVDLLGYNLYRRQGDEPFPFEPLNRELLTKPAFDDYDVENGQAYIYAVRTVARILGNSVESQLSATAETTPKAGL